MIAIIKITTTTTTMATLLMILMINYLQITQHLATGGGGGGVAAAADTSAAGSGDTSNNGGCQDRSSSYIFAAAEKLPALSAASPPVSWTLAGAAAAEKGPAHQPQGNAFPPETSAEISSDELKVKHERRRSEIPKVVKQSNTRRRRSTSKTKEDEENLGTNLGNILYNDLTISSSQAAAGQRESAAADASGAQDRQQARILKPIDIIKQTHTSRHHHHHHHHHRHRRHHQHRHRLQNEERKYDHEDIDQDEQLSSHVHGEQGRDFQK